MSYLTRRSLVSVMQTHASEELKRQVQNLEAELRGLITAQSQVSRPDPSENSAVSSALSASVEQTLKRTDELEQSMRSLQDEQVRLTRALDSRDQRSKSELAELSSTVRLQGAASIAVEQRLDQHDTVIAALQTAQQQLRDALSEVEAKAHASSPAESGVAAAGSATEVARLRGAVEQLMQAQQQSTEASGKAEAVIRQFATRVATVEDSVAAARNGPAAALNVEALQNLHRDLTKLVDTSVSSSQLGAVEQRVAQVEQKQQLAEQSSRATAAAVAEQAATLTAYQEQTRQRADRSDVQLKALTEVRSSD
jgi:vacuolar-type H+-ATPase subunit I/STV1